jgi:hypothetical protein
VPGSKRHGTFLKVKAAPPENSIYFFDELPIPHANLAIYKEVYVLEQWLRRIAYAALLGTHGRNWQGTLDAELLGELKKRLRQLEGRVHLDCENSENAIWLLTLDELGSVLLRAPVWPAVKKLTLLPKRVIGAKVTEVRELRNVVGHSRAVGDHGELLARAASATLHVGIDNFKNQLLYEKWETEKVHVGSADDYPGGSFPAQFAERTARYDPSKFQPMLSESDYFFSLTRLPVEPFNHFVAVKNLLNKSRSIYDDLLAILINKTGDEFTLVWPKKAEAKVHEKVLTAFLASHDSAWTERAYEEQAPAAICDPAIWFYENELPERI